MTCSAREDGTLATTKASNRFIQALHDRLPNWHDCDVET